MGGVPGSSYKQGGAFCLQQGDARAGVCSEVADLEA